MSRRTSKNPKTDEEAIARSVAAKLQGVYDPPLCVADLPPEGRRQVVTLRKEIVPGQGLIEHTIMLYEIFIRKRDRAPIWKPIRGLSEHTHYIATPKLIAQAEAAAIRLKVPFIRHISARHPVNRAQLDEMKQQLTELWR